jgi:hypothetical protein
MKTSHNADGLDAIRTLAYLRATAGSETRRLFGHWWEEVCNQLCALRQQQRQRELAQSPRTAVNH